MKIESEYNGIQHGELCWVWDDNEKTAVQKYFTGYVSDRTYPIKTIDRCDNQDKYKNAKPIQTEVKLDTRRVAGWWCTWEELDEMQYVREVSKDGKSLVLNTKCYASELRSNAVFSKDPMKPLSEWQTLEQICGGES